MKRVWKPFRWWSLAGLGYGYGMVLIAVWMLKVMNYLWSIHFAYELTGLLVTLGLIYLLYLVMDWLFSIHVYEVGDTLVIKRRSLICQVPFDQITSVERLRGGVERIRLTLSEPCALGSTITFKISNRPSNEKYCPVADDIHRRSLCCREGNTHEVISAH
jgi:hypothetical protein